MSIVLTPEVMRKMRELLDAYTISSWRLVEATEDYKLWVHKKLGPYLFKRVIFRECPNPVCCLTSWYVAYESVIPIWVHFAQIPAHCPLCGRIQSQ